MSTKHEAGALLLSLKLVLTPPNVFQKAFNLNYVFMALISATFSNK